MSQQPEETIKVDFEVDLGERGGIQRFRSVEDVETWVAQEKESWQWINTQTNRTQRNPYAGLLNDFDKYANRGRPTGSGQVFMILAANPPHRPR